MISRQRDKDTPKIPDLDTPAPLETTPTIENYWMRWILLAFGWANLGLGIVGGFHSWSTNYGILVDCFMGVFKKLPPPPHLVMEPSKVWLPG